MLRFSTEMGLGWLSVLRRQVVSDTLEVISVLVRHRFAQVRANYYRKTYRNT
jgi:hypothetical protein